MRNLRAYCLKLNLNVSHLRQMMAVMNEFYTDPVIFASTVLATLPTRTASQGESFVFKTFSNTPPMPISEAHLGGFFFLRPCLNTLQHVV